MPSKFNHFMRSSIIASMFAISQLSFAHETISSHSKGSATADYLGNEGVLVTIGELRILFDPFFHNNYGQYTLVPEKLRSAIFANQPPFNDINAVFISHAHGDHFDAKDVVKYLSAYSRVKLYAPEQAVQSLKEVTGFEKIHSQVVSIKLAYKDKAWSQSFGPLTIEALRIPHAGWPSRAEVENIVFRVTGEQNYTVMHAGDADPKSSHYQPYESFFKKRKTSTAFVPYWFFASEEGRQILNHVLNTKQSIGVHVPTNVPPGLKAQSHFDYFSKPGEQREIPKNN